MIRPSQVWLVVEAVDMRGGVDGLSQRIQNLLGRSPCDGTAYAFRNRRATRLKLLIWDGTGVCLFAKRLEDGKFRWPAIRDGVIRLTAAQLSALLEGLDWRRVHEARETPAPTAPS